ncbi:PREDICTED: MMS19 nucleotide excision repair protein homolog [Papilio polytes]|uniref:MMS19 nucleotide excision repair protein homolog n=1 Tax=Papilio polytes TaxID=76194 RepID=UPI0006767D7F|nr:PREDICTED: MMS19 nucleotide excision repair protein homolog [Papilio polytes]
MESIWFKPEFSNEIIQNPNILDQTQNVITDIISGRIEITTLVENMAGVLTNKDVDKRDKGMRFFTKMLKELPQDYLSDIQIKFISKFYEDRLKDNHKIIPTVLEGYLAVIDMKNYNMQNCGEFFTTLFREVPCQSQVRQDRHHIYLIVQKLLDKDVNYIKSLGPDFVYGVISSIEGERDPRNLLFLFNFIPTFLNRVPLGHLTEEMFDVISCYYPIDFHPSPNDPAAVTRQDLAAALIPCMCAVPEFAEHCLVLLVEKLDSTLRVAKIDSLKLLAESCKTFKPESYKPFLKTLWSSIHREITHKTDSDLKMAAHEALSGLVSRLATTVNTDQEFENFVKAIIISIQTALASSSTVSQFSQSSKILLTTANASMESCFLVTKCMVPAIAAYYEFKTSSKLQIASIEFLGDLYDIAKHWNMLKELDEKIDEILQLCLLAVSQTSSDYQIAGFRTMIKMADVLKSNLILPFVEVLTYNVQHSQDSELLKISVEAIHAIARYNPEIIMNLVVKGKCELDNLMEDKTNFQKRLNLLSNLASIDVFTTLIVEEMLKIITDDRDSAPKVVEALNESMSDTTLYTDEKITEIESDHGLTDSVINWLLREIKLGTCEETYNHGFMLISNTISSLPEDKQQIIISKYTNELLDECKTNDMNFLIIESLYLSIHENYYDVVIKDIMTLALRLSLNSEIDTVRMKACVLVGHFLNKADHGQKFDLLYELLKDYLSSCRRDDLSLCPRLIQLYAWITKALVMRSSGQFLFWLEKILVSITSEDYAKEGAEAIRLIVSDFQEYLSRRQHCRITPFYKQRIFQSFSNLTAKLDLLNSEVKEYYLLSWAYILAKTPKSVLNNHPNRVSCLVIDGLEYDNKDLLVVMLDVLCHFVQAKHGVVADSLQTILPRLIKLSTYVKSMDVRIKSLQNLFEIAKGYPTSVLLPYKQDVLLEIAPSLDDKKRLVRNMAVQARTRWFLVGAPGENKDN